MPVYPPVIPGPVAEQPLAWAGPGSTVNLKGLPPDGARQHHNLILRFWIEFLKITKIIRLPMSTLSSNTPTKYTPALAVLYE